MVYIFFIPLLWGSLCNCSPTEGYSMFPIEAASLALGEWVRIRLIILPTSPTAFCLCNRQIISDPPQLHTWCCSRANPVSTGIHWDDSNWESHGNVLVSQGLGNICNFIKPYRNKGWLWTACYNWLEGKTSEGDQRRKRKCAWKALNWVLLLLWPH